MPVDMLFLATLARVGQARRWRAPPRLRCMAGQTTRKETVDAGEEEGGQKQEGEMVRESQVPEKGRGRREAKWRSRQARRKLAEPGSTAVCRYFDGYTDAIQRRDAKRADRLMSYLASRAQTVLIHTAP